MRHAPGSVPVLDAGVCNTLYLLLGGIWVIAGRGQQRGQAMWAAISIRAAQLSLQLGVLGRFCGLELMSARLVISGGILVFNGGVGW